MKMQKRTPRTASKRDKNIRIMVLKSRGEILRAIKGNVSFTAIKTFVKYLPGSDQAFHQQDNLNSMYFINNFQTEKMLH